LLSLGGGAISESQWIQDSNTGGTAGTTFTPSAGYVLADHSSSAASVNLGRYHINGTAPTSSLTLGNSAPATTGNVTESLVVSQGTLTGPATLTGLPESHLVQGSTQGVTVGLTAAVGAQTGSVQLNFNSTQTGSSSARVGGDLSVGSRTISLTGFGYDGKSEWTADSGGSWNLDSYDNWSANGGTPGMDGTASQEDTALFGSAATANRTIALNGSNAALQSLTFNNATASYTLSQGSGGTMTLGSAGSEGALTNSAGTHTLSAPLVLGNKLTVNSAANSSIRLEGAVSGSHGLVKSGAGRLVIEGTTTYSGLTDVQEGTFVVNGSTAGDLTIGSNAQLEGSGTIGGNTTISGTHSPGNSPDIQTFGADLTYTNGSAIIWELINNTIEGRGTNYDGIDVEGNLDFSGSTTLNLAFAIAESNIDFTNEFWSSSYLGTNGWKIFDVMGDITGFENLTLTGTLLDSEGVVLSAIRSEASFSLFEGADGIYLNYNAIPEPSTVLFLSLASLSLFKRRRG
jgi:autotransporter-associated beta strand protein